MKMILALALMAASSAAFAGTGASGAQPVCYRLQQSSTAKVDADIPSAICLEKLSLDLATQKVSVHTSFQADLFQDVRILQTSRHNEDVISFSVKSTIEDIPVVCSDGTILDIQIDGRANNQGEAFLNDLKVQVTKTVGDDFCHGYGDSTVYNYSKE